jgi:hypothetical protein
MDDLTMSDLQDTNFNGFPEFSEQEADALRQNIQPTNTPLSTAAAESHCTDDEYRDLFEPDTAIPSIEQSPPTPIKNENAENFATNNAVYVPNNEASVQLLIPAHTSGLKNESADPTLFSAEDMDAIFGKTTVFDDNFKLDDTYKLKDSSPTAWTNNGKNQTTLTLASPFKPETKLDYSYMDVMRISNAQPHPRPEHVQEHGQPQPSRQMRPSQETFTEYTHPSMIEDPQTAVYRFPDGRRRSQTMPLETRMGMRPPANMGHPHAHPHQQQHAPQPQFHRVMADHRHHPMTPTKQHLRHHTPAVGPMPAVLGFGRGQPVFHRHMESRARAVSPEPKRKRQKIGHFVEAPQREMVSHLFESLMGNVEFVVRQGLAGMKYRIDDEFERFVFLVFSSCFPRI